MTTIRAEAHAVQDGVRDDAWDAIVTLDREHGQRLYGYALRLGVDSGRAADLVQEALIRLWHELGRGTVVVSPEAWTYRALSRLAMDEHRLHRRIAGLVSRLGDRTTARVMEVDSTERLAIWAQVDSLPDRQRRVIYLRYQADLSFEEIGHVMGIEPGAARSYATAAHRTLRTKLVGPRCAACVRIVRAIGRAVRAQVTGAPCACASLDHMKESRVPVHLRGIARSSTRRRASVSAIDVVVGLAFGRSVTIGASPLPSQATQLPAPYGPAANGAIVYGANGDIYLADASGGNAARLIATADEA